MPAEHARNLARRLGDAIVGLSRPSDPRPARIWLTDAVSGLDIPVRDLGLGVGGVVLVLAELVDAFNEPAHRSVLRDGANWLRQAPAPEGPGAAGLYAGEAGVGTALLRAGQVLADPRLIDAAEAYSRSLAKRSHICPDLYSGSAGRLRFHLMLWDETGADEHLSFAVEAGEALLSARRSFGPGVAWPMPDGCGSLSRRAWLGYAHGAAGIADSFLDLADATDERSWLEPASDTLVLLRRLARPALGDMDGLQWPSVLDVAQSRGGASWCHGAAGIGRFLLHASQVGLDADAIEQTRRAGRTVARGARWAVPVQCHGLAGAIEFLLDLARYTGEAAHLEEAWVLSRLLETFLVERNGLLLAASDSPERVTPDYSTGVAGIAACFLRLADRHRSHLLSRSAFNHRLNSSGA